MWKSELNKHLSLQFDFWSWYFVAATESLTKTWPKLDLEPLQFRLALTYKSSYQSLLNTGIIGVQCLAWLSWAYFFLCLPHTCFSVSCFWNKVSCRPGWLPTSDHLFFNLPMLLASNSWLKQSFGLSFSSSQNYRSTLAPGYFCRYPLGHTD